MKLNTCLVSSLLFLGLFLCACSSPKSSSNSRETVPPSGMAGVDENCKSSYECRRGLSCLSGKCLPGNHAIHGAACTLSAECTDGEYCSYDGKCDTSGSGGLGSVCSTDGDCIFGLACALEGLTGVCARPGSGDLGKACGQTNDCMAGLFCAKGACTKPNLLPGWAGASCASQEEMVPKIYFKIPRSTDGFNDTDFYRLPFPNDIRRINGKILLTGHPRPGSRPGDFDLVDRYIRAIEAEPMGFGANQTIYFRFSRMFAANSLHSPGVFTFVDITPSSPTYGDSQAFSWGPGTSRSTYMCSPYVWIRPASGRPLLPGTTYAVLIGKSITDTTGTPFIPDDDFSAMLAESGPKDAELLHAHQAYAPLRAYIADGKARRDDLLAAAVFTVDAYEDPWAKLVATLKTQSPATVETLVRCEGSSTPSPCGTLPLDRGPARGCPEKPATDFDEYQGTLSLPVFQQGNTPFLTPAAGGGIIFDGQKAVLQRWESVCFALTLPEGAIPSQGFPLVVYAHGTGGNYRSFIASGLAEDFAHGSLDIDLPANTQTLKNIPMGMLGLDGILHGTRKGGSNRDEGALVYNFLNPVAARDNVLQAASDIFFFPTALPSLEKHGVRIDTASLALYGHSQGGQAATLVAAHASPYGAFVFSGTGGTLLYTLLLKTSPINLPAHLPYLLGESDPKALDGNHPVLNLMQLYFERSDSVNFARRILTMPETGMAPRHVLHVLGTSDTYTVIETQRAYAVAANLPVAIPVIDAYGLTPAMPPLRNNGYFGYYGSLTAGQIQYQPADGHDGHFVSIEHPQARRSIQNFLGSYLRDKIPTIVP